MSLLFRRSMATAASTVSSRPNLSTAIILNRAPLITRTQTDFERAYYAYQARIRRALHNPFPYDLYFKQGSLIETRFNQEERRRELRAFGSHFVKNESSVIKSMSTPDREALAAVEQLKLQEGEGAEVMPRRNEADEKNDVKSLDRRGKRNLYLLVKQRHDGSWRFPQGGVQTGELLHQAAQRDLNAEAGPNMDTWIVSRNPIGHYKSPDAPENVTFFFKAHIMAGQARPEEKSLADFAWLTKEEIRSYLGEDSSYWNGVKDMLSDH